MFVYRGFDMDHVPTTIISILANSFLVGHGIAGAVRLIAAKQFDLRFMFCLTAITALFLFGYTGPFYPLQRWGVFVLAGVISLVMLTCVKRTRKDTG